MPIKNQGKLEQLETIFKNKLEKDSKNPAVLEMVAEIHRNARDHEKAAEAYQALCKAQPGNTRSFFYAAAALQKKQPTRSRKRVDQSRLRYRGFNQSLAHNSTSFFTHDTRVYLC